ncbi:uncharacterized protein LOC143922191 [Arctopsyche grandis]|uniref:uncharacterized protein LOC143922191 n=1 Tax=Arctopsyche grandis TaxID=121162 RepID=UPI00406D97DA
MQQQAPKAYIIVSNDKNEIQKTSAYTAKTLSSIIKTCLGPRAMQKMVLTKINSIEMSNDGNSILREMDVNHPSARCLIELSRTQDEECGDGTTSVLIFASELLNQIVPHLKTLHPIKVCNILRKAKDICINHLNTIAMEAAESDLINIVTSSVATKLCCVLKLPIPELALRSVQLIKSSIDGRIDVKNDIKIEKILGNFDECEIIEGIILEKEIIHSQMRRSIENPKILILDMPLEYRKGESVTNMEFSNKNDFTRALEIEEEQIHKMCGYIVDTGADIVITEKGISDLALSILYEKQITAIRRIKKSDSNRISKATGATVLNRLEDASPKHLGEAGMFEYVKIGKEYFCKLSKCKNPKAISVILRGPTRDVLTEIERNFMDAVKVARNVLLNPKLVPGGGASEMSMALKLNNSNDKEEKIIFRECGVALKVIPSILSTNSGNGICLDVINELEKKQNKDGPYFGINGITGEISDMKNIVLEPLVVKTQCIKSGFEAVMQILRVDGIIESKSK